MYYLIISTIDDKGKAKEIAKHLVGKKLSPCVNIIDKALSIYEWKGKIEESEEFVLFIKTTYEKLAKLLEELERIHPYEVPEIIAIKIEKGNESYLSWINETLKVS